MGSQGGRKAITAQLRLGGSRLIDMQGDFVAENQIHLGFGRRLNHIAGTEDWPTVSGCHTLSPAEYRASPTMRTIVAWPCLLVDWACAAVANIKTKPQTAAETKFGQIS